MSPENEVTYRSQEFKKAPEIATKRPVQTASIAKLSNATTHDGPKIKLEPNMKFIVKLTYNKTDRKARENHIKDMKRQQNLSSSFSSSSSFSTSLLTIIIININL